MNNESENPLIDLDFKEIYDVLSGFHLEHEIPKQFSLEKLHNKYLKIKQSITDPVQAFEKWEDIVALEIGTAFSDYPKNIQAYYYRYDNQLFTAEEEQLVDWVKSQLHRSFDWVLNQGKPIRYGLSILKEFNASDNIINEYKLFYPYYNYPINISDASQLWTNNIKKQIRKVQELLSLIANTSKYYLKTARRIIKATPYINHTKLILFYWLELQKDIYSDHCISPFAVENLLYQTKTSLRDETDVFICWFWYRSQLLIKTKYWKEGKSKNYLPRNSAKLDRLKLLSIVKKCESIRYGGYRPSNFKTWDNFGDLQQRIKISINKKLLDGNDALNRYEYIEILYKHIYSKELIKKLIKQLETPPVDWNKVRY